MKRLGSKKFWRRFLSAMSCALKDNPELQSRLAADLKQNKALLQRLQQKSR